MSREAADGLNALTRFYLWDGDLIRCRRCKRGQQVTWREHDFAHASDCKNETAEPRPWLRFCELVQSAGHSGRDQNAA